jgi:hypothetical protein
MSEPVGERPIAKRPSRLRAWVRAVLVGIVSLVLLASVAYGIRAYIVRTRLLKALAQLDQAEPGWRLQDVEAARAAVPDAQNSASVILDLGQKLPKQPNRWIEADFDDQLQKTGPEKRMDPEQLARLRQRLDAVRPVLEEAGTLRAMPNGRFPVAYAPNPGNTRLDAEQKTREVCRLLQLDAMAEAEAGDPHAALEACRASLNAARSIGDEPTAVSQLIRVATVTSTCKMAGRVLAQGEPDEGDLKAFQEMLKDEDAFPYWDVTLRGERALQNTALDALESGKATLSELAGDPPDWQERFLPFLTEDYVRAVHPDLFTYMAKLRAAGELPPRARDQAMQQIVREARAAGPNPVTLFMPAFAKLADAFARCHAVLRCTAVALAAERYRRLHGDWPKSLDQLAPDLLDTVPTDPFTGDPLLYQRLLDGVVIYSTSSDGVDNGGTVDAENPASPGADVGVRLWDVAKRRQPPALPAAPGPPR